MMRKIEVGAQIEIKRYGYRSKTIWTYTDLHCPECGTKSIWEDNDSDYYNGTMFVCLNCETEFHYFESGSSKRQYAAMLKGKLIEQCEKSEQGHRRENKK